AWQALARAGGGRNRGTAPQGGRPGARSTRSVRACPGLPRACVAGLAFYPEADLQRLDIQMGVGQQPLEPAVLGLELLQALGVLGLRAAVLGPPGVEAGGTEAVLATQFRHRHAGLGLLDESDDLLGCEATLAHVRLLGLTDFTAPRGTAQPGQVKARKQNPGLLDDSLPP